MISSLQKIVNSESGTGCVQRIRDHMSNNIKMKNDVMFRECVSEINKELNGMLNKIHNGISERVTETLTSFFTNLNMFWDSKCLLPKPIRCTNDHCYFFYFDFKILNFLS